MKMPMIFNAVDHKVVAVATFAATASVAAYALYRLRRLKQQMATMTEDVYETAKSLNEHLICHYGSPDEIMPWSFGPKASVEFQRRCAELCVKHAREASADKPQRALDVGCAVGRATFELARTFDEVVGIDLSKSFIDTCRVLQDKGQLHFTALQHGDIVTNHVAVVDHAIDRSKVQFQRADACTLPLDIGQFDCVLAANVICRLHTPHAFLDRLPSLICPGGILVISTAFEFLPQFTPRENWIGGWVTKSGEEYTGFDALRSRLEAFDFIHGEEMPQIVRETERKYVWTVCHTTVWRRH